MSNTFTIIGLIAESTLKLTNDTRSKIFGNPIFEMKAVTQSGVFLNAICNLQQLLRIFYDDLFKLTLVCKDID